MARNAMEDFKGAVRGWAFSDLNGLKRRLAAGEREIALMKGIWSTRDQAEADELILMIVGAIHAEEKKRA